MSFNTDLLHAGVVREANGATLPPVYQSSAFEQDTAADLEKIFENKAPGYCYTRVGNPTVTAFENRITKLEGGMASIACASGMAAIMNAILNIVRSAFCRDDRQSLSGCDRCGKTGRNCTCA